MDEAPTYIFLLVRADEGSTQEIFAAQGTSLSVLADIVSALYNDAIAICEGPYKDANQEYLAQERQALLAMVAMHTPLSPGRYLLRNVEPIWEQCTLIIAPPVGGGFAA
jgi:hypothetical protein